MTKWRAVARESPLGFSLIAGEGDSDNGRFEILGGELRALEKESGQIVEAVNVDVGLWRLRIKLPEVEQTAFFRLVFDYAE